MDSAETERLAALGWEITSATSLKCSMCAQAETFETLLELEPQHRWFCPNSRNAKPLPRKRERPTFIAAAPETPPEPLALDTDEPKRPKVDSLVTTAL